MTDMNGGAPGPGNLTLLLGNGDGTFTPATVSPVTGSTPESVAVADFNGDGKLDLVTGNSGGNSVTVLMGNGDGTFAAPQSFAADTSAIFAAVGDFNGDGLSDVAAANNIGASVTILLARETLTATAAAVRVSLPGSGQQLVEARYGGDAKHRPSVSATVPVTGSGASLSRPVDGYAVSVSPQH